MTFKKISYFLGLFLFIWCAQLIFSVSVFSSNDAVVVYSQQLLSQIVDTVSKQSDQFNQYSQLQDMIILVTVQDSGHIQAVKVDSSSGVYQIDALLESLIWELSPVAQFPNLG